MKQHKLLPTLVCICVQVETCKNFSQIGYKRVKMYDLIYLGASKLLRYKRYFIILQLRCKRKIYKEIYRMFAGDSQMLRNKRHFVISVIAINVFYCTYLLEEFYLL